MATREQHLEWAKKRALEYVEAGELNGAVASMNSDLAKHPDLISHTAIGLGLMLQMNGHLDTRAKVREWIEGFK